MKSSIAHSLATLTVLTISISMGSPVASAQTQHTKTAEQRAGAKLQPLNVKPGLWESTTTYTRSGEMPLTPEMLEHMSPEQRARLEERLKANSGTTTHTITDKNCVTQDDIRNAEFGVDKKQCTQTITASSSTTAKGNLSCEFEGARLNGSIEVNAPDPEHVKGTTHMVTTGGGHSMKVDGTFTSKWLGSRCHSGE